MVDFRKVWFSLDYIKMGLDMYLTGKKYIWFNEPEIKEELKKILKTELTPQEVVFDIITWRKANAIHKWFVDNVQEGSDDCKEYNVDEEQLKELLELIKRIIGESQDKREKIVVSLNKMALAQELLPSQSGCFYGDLEYDEWYFNELERTRDLLNDIFNNPEKYEGIDFYYSSSW